ncbi:MAG: hypothetical protein AAF311_10950 [Pseudomonadota bacterium]
MGDPLDIATAVTTAVIGVYAISAAFVGWLRGPEGAIRRVLIGVAGLALLLPPGVGGDQTLLINGIGLAALVLLWVSARRAPATPPTVPVNEQG